MYEYKKEKAQSPMYCNHWTAYYYTGSKTILKKRHVENRQAYKKAWNLLWNCTITRVSKMTGNLYIFTM